MVAGLAAATRNSLDDEKNSDTADAQRILPMSRLNYILCAFSMLCVEGRFVRAGSLLQSPFEPGAITIPYLGFELILAAINSLRLRRLGLSPLYALVVFGPITPLFVALSGLALLRDVAGWIVATYFLGFYIVLVSAPERLRVEIDVPTKDA